MISLLLAGSALAKGVFFFFQAVALMIYIIGLSVCGVWFWCCLITAGLHVHPLARGASITLPLYSSNSQNDVIIPFFPSLTPHTHSLKHKNIHARSHRYFLWLSAPLCHTHTRLQRETEGHSLTKEEHFVPLTWSPLPTVDEGPQSLAVNEGQLQPGPWEPPVEPFNECHFLALTTPIVG